MSTLWLAAFTKQGCVLAQELLQKLSAAGYSVRGYAPEHFADGELYAMQSVGEFAEQAFEQAQGIVFIGACGIAVRAVAPFLKRKSVDPAVVVLDEKAQFSISLLAGHLGGANRLAQLLAALTGAQAVVTTATDVNGVFAVDTWADGQKLCVYNPEAIKWISSALLAGKSVGFCSELPVEGTLPVGLVPEKTGKLGICISRNADRPFEQTLCLIPRDLVLGIGCRKGIGAAAVEQAAAEALHRAGVLPERLAAAASIDLKKEEAGLLAFCKAHRIPLNTYSADELNAVPGTFTASAFVQSVTGADNVCERAAVRASGSGTLLLSKTAGNGVTAALARKLPQGLRFE